MRSILEKYVKLPVYVSRKDKIEVEAMYVCSDFIGSFRKEYDNEGNEITNLILKSGKELVVKLPLIKVIDIIRSSPSNSIYEE